MKKKQNKNIVMIILVILVGIYLINYFGVFEKDSLFTIVDTPIEEGTKINEDYFCPSNAHHCVVRGVIECNNPSGEVPNIIFRTNANSANDYNDVGTWIAINGIPSSQTFIETSNLKSYCRSSSISTSNFINRLTPHLNRIGVRNGHIFIETEGSWRKYLECSSADLSSMPKEPYTSNNQELTEGSSNPYYCEGLFKIGGLLVDSPIYSSNSAGSISTLLVTDVKPNDQVQLSGGDINYIEYKALERTETCPEGDLTCIDGNKYVCHDNNYDVFEICDFGCSNDKCSSPFEAVDIQIKDDNGIVKSAFTPEEDINIYVNVISDLDVSSINVKIVEETPTGNVFDEILQTTEKYEFGKIEFTGDYYVILEINAGLNDPIIYGRTSLEQNKIEIANNINAELGNPSQNLGGIDISLAGYTGYPLRVKYRITDVGGNPLPIGLVTPNVYYTINNGNQNTISPKTSEVGLLTYEIIPTLPGDYKFYGTITKGSFVTPLDTSSMDISMDELSIEWVQKPMFVEKGTSATYSFTTKNKNGDLIESTNSIEVRKLGVIDKTITPTGSLGEYSFTNNFDTRGDYSLIISSSAVGLSSPQPVSSGTINVGDKPAPKCSETNPCGFLQECVDGTCETNIGMISLIFISITIIIVIIVILISFIKKKNKPSFGGL